MPHLVDNMTITVINKIYCKTKNNCFKLRHAPYFRPLSARLTPRQSSTSREKREELDSMPTH